MKHFFSLFLTWAMLILACTLFYVAVAVSFPTSLINIIAAITGGFFLVQGFGKIDEEHGFGKFNKEDETKAK